MNRRTPLGWARAQLGQREQGGPNRGPIVARCMQLWTDAEPGDRSLWCAYFASTALVHGGAEQALAVGSSSAETLHDRMRPWWVDEMPQAGDVAWFPRAGNRWHVGLVSDVRGEGPELEVTTVEGNAQNAVLERVYKWAVTSIKGLARPRLLGICGAFPPACAGAMRPCRQPAGHLGNCDSFALAGIEDAPRLQLPGVGDPRQARALRVLREQGGMDVQRAADRFGLSVSDWLSLERGACALSAEEFARVCRGLSPL